jgi:hypothetical protein
VNSQLLGSDFCDVMRVNSNAPVSGHMRYRLGCPWAGSFNVTILASEEVPFGNIKTFGGFESAGGNVLLRDSSSSTLGSGFAVAFDPRVRAIEIYENEIPGIKSDPK